MKTVEQRHEIPLSLRRDRADEAGLETMRTDHRADRFDVMAGTVTWEDRTKDHGFKVRITTKEGGQFYL